MASSRSDMLPGVRLAIVWFDAWKDGRNIASPMLHSTCMSVVRCPLRYALKAAAATNISGFSG